MARPQYGHPCWPNDTVTVRRFKGKRLSPTTVRGPFLLAALMISQYGHTHF